MNEPAHLSASSHDLYHSSTADQADVLKPVRCFCDKTALHFSVSASVPNILFSFLKRFQCSFKAPSSFLPFVKAVSTYLDQSPKYYIKTRITLNRLIN